jgi:hypothetical protein
MEREWAGYYHKAPQSARRPSVRESEVKHKSLARELGANILTKVRVQVRTKLRGALFVLQYVQPELWRRRFRSWLGGRYPLRAL